MGYCLSQLPPEGIKATYEDFLRYAKFQLSVDKHLLIEDPIWDKYSDEQLLVEYYANMYSKSKAERDRFESLLLGDNPDLHEWFDKKIKQNKEEMEAKAAKLEDQVRFSPDTLGD